ncbi:MAG: RNA polymerase sigma-70 factor [Bacteroidia bacterium]
MSYNLLKHIYIQNYESLCRFAQFYLDDAQLAEDAVQQLFLKLIDNKVNLTLIKNQKAYLMTSLKNQILNDLRKEKILVQLETEDFVADTVGLHEKLEATELHDKIKKLIEQLPEKCRYIFRLSREENMSYKQISELLEISPKTVENQISKALKYLKEKIFLPHNQ